MRTLGLAVFEAYLEQRSRITPYGRPDGFHATTINSLLGYARYTRAYYAPVLCRMTRQARRRQEREKAAEHHERRKRNATVLRTGGAPCACPFDTVLKIKDGMTSALGDLAQRAAAFCGSFAEGTATLQRFAGVSMPISTLRRKALSAGTRAIAAQEFPALRLLTPYFPAWLLAATTETIPTLYIMPDGTGIPCVKKDTQDVKGKGEDGKAKTRELKVAIVGTYRRLNAKGHPVRDPGCESHIVSEATAIEFGQLLRQLANSRGYNSGLFRIQIVGDGAEWIENIVRMSFPSQDVIFTNDFYHACEYLHDFLSLAMGNSAAVPQKFKRARAILLRYGGATLVRHLRKHHGQLPPTHEAWKKLNYIEERVNHMKYGEYRKAGLFIGSGPVEAACRTDVARRCKQAGMHWCLKNGAAICALVARFRSNLAAA